MYAARLDAAASQQADQQRAMNAASDNAEDLNKSLSNTANQVRQAGITTEIMEIVGGAEALRQASAQGGGRDLLADRLDGEDLFPDQLGDAFHLGTQANTQSRSTR